MITAQIENCMAGITEREALIAEHYKVLSLHQQHGFPLAPQYHVYAQREANGELLYATLRDNGVLIGYFVGTVAPGLHYSTCLTLVMDIFFVSTEHRGKFGGVKLFKCVMAEAKRRGVAAAFVGHKTHEPEAKRLFALFGFGEVETMYCKWLDGSK
jgi:hypothetical protein